MLETLPEEEEENEERGKTFRRDVGLGIEDDENDDANDDGDLKPAK